MQESPTIQSIELINFMCHKHLFLEFKKNLTCIGGRNGSGKSAIMIAIGLIFGQRAYSLERGNSYKDLIKSDQKIAVIRVQLYNQPKFKYSFFQDTILIEKRFRADSTVLTISNKDKKLYSHRKEDLDYILDIFCLKFDNPLNFLTQEQSKKFLNVSKPELLYNLFMKGTEIEDMHELHKQAEEHITSMEQKIAETERELKDTTSELKESEEGLKTLSDVKIYTKKIEDLKKELKLSELKEKEAEMDNLKKEILKNQEEASKNSIELDTIIKDKNNIQQQIERKREEYNQLKINYDNKNSERNRSMKEYELSEKEILCDIKSLEFSINSKLKNKVELEEELEKIKSFNNKEVLEELKNKIKKSEFNISKNKELINNLNEEENILSEKAEEEDQNAKKQKSKIFQLKQQKNYYENVQKNQQSFFSDKMGLILDKIKATKFREQVIGPIGLHIKLKEHKWYKAVSIILKNSLSYFIVFNKEDKTKLSEIFSSYNANFTILLPSNSNPKAPLISFEKNSKFKTVLDVLEISNNLITNQLIILHSIEQ